MAIISHKDAKNLLIVDPGTGIQIPHVYSADPDQGWIEVYSCYPAHSSGNFDMMVKSEGQSQWVPYTFMSLNGGSEYMTARHYCGYDLVDKNTGEVIREVEGPQANLRLRDPAQWALQQRNSP